MVKMPGLNRVKSGVSNFSAVSLSFNQGYPTPLLRQLMFWCECSTKGGFPVIAETTSSKLVSTDELAAW